LALLAWRFRVGEAGGAGRESGLVLFLAAVPLGSPPAFAPSWASWAMGSSQETLKKYVFFFERPSLMQSSAVPARSPTWMGTLRPSQVASKLPKIVDLARLLRAPSSFSTATLAWLQMRRSSANSLGLSAFTPRSNGQFAFQPDKGVLGLEVMAIAKVTGKSD
jgi:hypothetical protein